jgi:hypothetical protein
MNIPNDITDICRYISQTGLQLSRPSNDGRLDSAINEGEILKLIREQFSVKLPQIRDWYDFAIEGRDYFYPINIKITMSGGTDNLNCKLGIYYALTGLMPCFSNEIKWLPYFEQLKDNIGARKDKDYYFIVINKQQTRDVFASSLKGLAKLIPNGNNLPFQCNWNKNREHIERDFEQASAFLLGCMGESIKLRAEIYFHFKRFFAQYV